MTGTSTPLLRLQQVHRSFGGLVAVDDLSMTIPPSQICGLIGPNGAGKTTVFNVITGVYRPQRGSIFLQDEEITSAKIFRITRLGIARTFQMIRLFPNLSTLEHVLVGQTHIAGNRSAALAEAERLLSLLGIWEQRNLKAVTLPYGAQRKVEIARALATRPKLLLLDEPVAGMNERETDELLKMVSKIRDLGVTILVIDHDMKFVMNICDYLFVLNFGRKIAEGTPGEIRSTDCVLEAYLGREG